MTASFVGGHIADQAFLLLVYGFEVKLWGQGVEKLESNPKESAIVPSKSKSR
jgi:hypothetical protein